MKVNQHCEPVHAAMSGDRKVPMGTARMEKGPLCVIRL